MRHLWLLGFALMVGGTDAAPQHDHGPVTGALDVLERPVPVRAGIGHAHDSLTTASPEAQQFYDQGLAYLHNYMWIEASRSFNQALRFDRDLALAYVGLSDACDAINRRDAADRAFEQARALAPRISDHERHHIEIGERRRAAERLSGQTPDLTAYRRALDTALAAFPSDVEFWLQRGTAESPDPADRGQSSVRSAVPYYERALEVAPDSFAAHHYLTHAFENGGQVDAALRHGRAYAQLAPSVPHALHMYGHELRKAGRADEAIAAFEQADRLERAYLEAEGVQPDDDWHYEHNLDLLGETYRYVGQLAKAEAALGRAFPIHTISLVQAVNKRAWPAFLRSLDRDAEALAAAQVLVDSPNPVVQAAGHVEAGFARLGARQFARAADESNAAARLLRQTPPGGALVARYLEQLQGEFYLRTGDHAKAVDLLRRAIEQARQLTGPDESIQALFLIESIGRAARETGVWSLAAEAAQVMAAQDAGYGGTHYALALVADHDGDLDRARSEFAQAQRLWQHADPNVAELMRIRAWRVSHDGAVR